MTTDAAGEPAPAAAAGRAGWARKLGSLLARWWSQTPDGRTYQRRRADALVAAAGLGIVVVCGVLVANRTLVGTDVAVFRRINHWPGWLYPPMWTVQLSGVIGALPLVAAAALLLRRLRLAVALAAAALLKPLLEAVAKMFVQRGRPAETLPDVILRGNSAAQGLSFPSGHAMVIFAIAALVAPYFKGWWKVLPWALAAAVCLSRVYLGAHFPLDVIAGAGLGLFFGGVLNLVFGVPGASTSTARASALRSGRVHGSPRPRGCGFAVNMRGLALPQSGVPEQPGYCHGRSAACLHRFACPAH
jgi:membrane-associated phospholipid phosphatase